MIDQIRNALCYEIDRLASENMRLRTALQGLLDAGDFAIPFRCIHVTEEEEKAIQRAMAMAREVLG